MIGEGEDMRRSTANILTTSAQENSATQVPWELTEVMQESS